MATIDLNWTNNSQGLNAQGTRIERVTGGNFTTGNVEVIATGNTGGLDPELANGSYTDSTVEGGKDYSYRAVTFGGSQNAESTHIGPKFVPDVDNELGYPGGYPETAARFNIATTPLIHLDFKRVIGLESIPTVARGANGKPSSEGSFLSQLTYGEQRLVPSSAKIYSRGGEGVAYIPPQEGSTKLVKSFLKTQGSTYGYYEMTHDDILLPDEYTYISAVISHAPSPYQPNFLTSRTAVRNGIIYNTNYASKAFGVSLNKPEVNEQGGFVYCERVLNTPAAAAGNGAKFQKFLNGKSVQNVDFLSYHTDPTNGYGAYYSKQFMTHSSVYYAGVAVVETFLFPKALDEHELNTIHTYLGEQLEKPMTAFDSSSVYHG